MLVKLIKTRLLFLILQWEFLLFSCCPASSVRLKMLERPSCSQLLLYVLAHLLMSSSVGLCTPPLFSQFSDLSAALTSPRNSGLEYVAAPRRLPVDRTHGDGPWPGGRWAAASLLASSFLVSPPSCLSSSLSYVYPSRSCQHFLRDLSWIYQTFFIPAVIVRVQATCLPIWTAPVAS